MLKIPESGLIHFLLYWLCYEKIAAISHINSAIKRKRSQNAIINHPYVLYGITRIIS